MKILHICAGWEKWNGAANIARMIMDEQRREGHDVSFATWAKMGDVRAADEVWIHCGWLPCLWWAAVVWCLTQRRRGAERMLKWMPEACYDPVRLKYHGWKKRLVGPIERWCLRRCTKIVATCEAEAEWIRAYEPRVKSIEVTDIKRFFNLSRVERVETCRGGRNVEVHVLYLGRKHLLKGVEYLETAVRQMQDSTRSTCSTRLKIELKIISSAFGEEKERVWDWCDVLVLPTLSDNFGLVIAEALERGKHVITTDGAPAWEKECKMENVKCKIGDGEIWTGYDGRLIYLKGYREGSDEERVELLKNAVDMIKHEENMV